MASDNYTVSVYAGVGKTVTMSISTEGSDMHTTKPKTGSSGLSLGAGVCRKEGNVLFNDALNTF